MYVKVSFKGDNDLHIGNVNRVAVGDETEIGFANCVSCLELGTLFFGQISLTFRNSSEKKTRL